MSEAPDPSQGPRISVTPDGPYLVTGGLPVARRSDVRSEQGEPLAWSSPTRVPAPESYALCRCGASGTKPFCDGSHERVGFVGTETAAPTSYGERSTTYPGTGIVVRDDRTLCEHAGFCSNHLSNVWKMVPQTADTVVRGQVMAMVERCPSGALTYRVDPAGGDVEPDLRPAVNVVADGPLWITGEVPVDRADGRPTETRSRITLCRCGASDNKPYCDGSHRDAGFTDQ